MNIAATALPALPRAAAASPVGTGRIAALDGLRGIAILLVVADHYCVGPSVPGRSPVLEAFQRVANLGFSGVDLFFVLSGFLIGGIVLDHRAAPNLFPTFYARRFFRIVPVYLLLLATFFIGREIPGLGHANYGTYFYSAVPTWSYAVFWQNVAMATTRDIGPYWLGVTWSLAVEEQFYLVAPMLIRRLSLRQVAWACVAVIGLVPFFRTHALYSAHNAYAAIFLLPARADGLMWGVLCACAVRSAAVKSAIQDHAGRWTAVCLSGGAIFGYLAWRNIGADSIAMITWGYSALGASFAVLVLGVVLFPRAQVVRLLGWRPLAITGITSYFIYLFHVPIWYGLNWWFFHHSPQAGRWQGEAVKALAVVVTFVSAQLSWRWCETPLLKIGHRFKYL